MTEEAMRKAFEAWKNAPRPVKLNTRMLRYGDGGFEGYVCKPCSGSGCGECGWSGLVDDAQATLQHGDAPTDWEWLAWQAATRAAAPAWQPIETAPVDGTEFLGLNRGRVATASRVPRGDCEMWVFGGTSGAHEYFPELRPSHWMPMPPAPEPKP